MRTHRSLAHSESQTFSQYQEQEEQHTTHNNDNNTHYTPRKQNGKDFFEGVRSKLIAKEKAGTIPRWSPATLKEVTDAQVYTYFGPLPVARITRSNGQKVEEEIKPLDLSDPVFDLRVNAPPEAISYPYTSNAGHTPFKPGYKFEQSDALGAAAGIGGEEEWIKTPGSDSEAEDYKTHMRRVYESLDKKLQQVQMTAYKDSTSPVVTGQQQQQASGNNPAAAAAAAAGAALVGAAAPDPDPKIYSVLGDAEARLRKAADPEARAASQRAREEAVKLATATRHLAALHTTHASGLADKSVSELHASVAGLETEQDEDERERLNGGGVLSDEEVLELKAAAEAKRRVATWDQARFAALLQQQQGGNKKSSSSPSGGQSKA